MRNPQLHRVAIAACLLTSIVPLARAAEEKIATAVYSRAGNGYHRVPLKDGSFKPEYYAISNGGQVPGTTTDQTVDKIPYPEIAEIAMRLLAGKNYHYATKADAAKLLIVLQWGATIGYNTATYGAGVADASRAAMDLRSANVPGGTSPSPWLREGLTATGETAADNQTSEAAAFEGSMIRMQMENRLRDQVNEPNARLLGFINEINDAEGIQRYAGGGTRFDDLMADVEESRYYIIISAYDFQEAVKRGKQKLLWVTRVSVRTPGNRFDDSIMAMMKAAARHFGEDSGKLIRGEETKGTVEIGETKFLGTVDERKPAPAKEEKK